MAHITTNSFSSYILTDEERLHGALLTLTQKQLIQNEIATIAEEKLALEVDPNNVMPFIQAEAGLAGQMAALKWLLDLSEASEEEIQKYNYPDTPTQEI